VTASGRDQHGVGVRPSLPVEAVGAVVLAAARQLRVEEDRAVRAELGDVGLVPPADHDVAVRQDLRVAHELRHEPVRRVDELPDEARARIPGVEPDQEHPRLRLDLRRCAVVEDTDEVRPVMACVVLPGETRAGTHLEVASLPAESPDDAPGLPADLVDAPGVARRDDQVPVCGEVDRVDVEVVERVALVRGMRLLDRDVIEAAPLEEHTAPRQLELLHDAADHLAGRRAAEPERFADRTS